MNKLLIIAATLLSLTGVSAQAENIRNWDAIKIVVTDLNDLKCLAAFKRSEDDYRACRTPVLARQYESPYAGTDCSIYDNRAKYREVVKLLRKEGYNRQSGKTYSKEWEKAYHFYGQYKFVSTTIKQDDVMKIACDPAVVQTMTMEWVNDTVDQELSILIPVLN